MEEWKEYKLGQLLNIKYGKDHKKLGEGDIPIFGSGGIMRYGNRSLYEGPSILIPRKGSLNNIIFANSPFWTVDTMFWSIIDKRIVEPLFLYYALCKKDFSSLNVGSAVPSLTVPVIENIDIVLPLMDLQNKIVSILKSLDDKIENNRRINENLEKQAHALFKSWFVDFEPFKDGKFVESELGMIPEGWKVGRVGELCEIKYGKDHKKIQDGDYPVYGSGGIMRYVNKNLYDKESVLIPRKGTLNNVIYINEPFWTVDTMFYTIMKRNNIAKFLYQFMIRQDLYSMNAGSAVPSMTTEILNNLKILIPSSEILINFDTILASLYKAKKLYSKKSFLLANLRDTLLPKLMSGELKVS